MGSGIGDPTSGRGHFGAGIDDLIAWEGNILSTISQKG